MDDGCHMYEWMMSVIGMKALCVKQPTADRVAHNLEFFSSAGRRTTILPRGSTISKRSQNGTNHKFENNSGTPGTVIISKKSRITSRFCAALLAVHMNMICVNYLNAIHMYDTDHAYAMTRSSGCQDVSLHVTKLIHICDRTSPL